MQLAIMSTDHTSTGGPYIYYNYIYIYIMSLISYTK